MAENGEIQNVAMVGTGVIGASWAAYYLARGFHVIATDPAPNAEASLRKHVDEAWKTLSKNGLSPSASRDRLTFAPSMAEALAKADFVQENAPERPDFKARLFAEMDDGTPPRSILASSSSSITMDVIQPAAANGAINYVIEDVMIGGFALVAEPVEHRVTAVKTFIVNYDAVVYQKDLGPDSLEIVKKMELYNPDKTWQATNDAWPETVEYGENTNCGCPILCHGTQGYDVSKTGHSADRLAVSLVLDSRSLCLGLISTTM